jgi:glycosyltransferase involved in cell wall biosynthesis
MSLAVCIVASEKRRGTTFPACLDSVVVQEPDEVVVVADFPHAQSGVRSFRVEPMLRNTIDALVKRDVGWVGSTSDAVAFLCDDHELAPNFVSTYREKYHNRGWDILGPQRYTDRPGIRHWLNIGQVEGYVGGHCVIVTRSAGRKLPWSAGPHHRNWDLLWTQQMIWQGARLAYADRDLSVVDIEPGATPWL